MKVYCYHDADPDGWGAAAAILHKYPEAELFQMNKKHRDQYTLVSGYDIVFMLDWSSCPLKDLEQLKENNKQFVFIDHHKTSLEKNKDKFEGIIDITKATATLAWEYLHPNENIPLILQHISDYDIWALELPETKSFMLLYDSINEEGREVEIIRDMINNYSEEDYKKMYEQAKLLQTYADKQIEHQLASGRKQEFVGHKAIVFFFSGMHYSELAQEALIVNPDVDFAVIVFLIEMPDGSLNYKYSLRSRIHSDVDVAKIAEKFPPGGGHKHAAAFITDQYLVQ